MTVRIDDELADFIDRATMAGEGSRAEVINRALKRELRRRAAQRDAQIYASIPSDLETDSSASWSGSNAKQVLSELD